MDDKSNEIVAIPDLLDSIDVREKILTIDSINTQKEIVHKIVYEKIFLFLKSNQRNLKDNIKTYFDLELKKIHQI